jgi:hypothetical protein
LSLALNRAKAIALLTDIITNRNSFGAAEVPPTHVARYVDGSEKLTLKAVIPSARFWREESAVRILILTPVTGVIYVANKSAPHP